MGQARAVHALQPVQLKKGENETVSSRVMQLYLGKVGRLWYINALRRCIIVIVIIVIVHFLTKRAYGRVLCRAKWLGDGLAALGT